MIKGVIAYGDSKTSALAYQPILEDNGRMINVSFSVQTIAKSSRTAASGAAEIDAELAAMDADPQYILFNLGVNDTGGATEATWKADITYILNAIHTKWPAATIYMMRFWRRDYEAICNTIDGWIADLVTALDYCELGPDERVFLENGDDGATYTVDGIHPNAAGYALTATQWQTVMGY